jgi:hypothetical protein
MPNNSGVGFNWLLILFILRSLQEFHKNSKSLYFNTLLAASYNTKPGRANKYAEKKSWAIPKQQYKISNWHEYNEALRNRGSIEFWISDDAIDQWYEENRIYDGAGAPKKFTDFAIVVCHEVRQVYRLPLRQCQGFIDSIFRIKKLDIACPDFSCLSKRLSLLEIKTPRYKITDKPEEDVAAIAIDSTGLKRFGRGEWHQAKHKVSAKRSWRKLHIAVDENHIIQAGLLTDRFVSDDSALDNLLDQVNVMTDQVTADGAYDKNPVYNKLSEKFTNAQIVIPPRSDAVYHQENHEQRNSNIQEIKTFGRMGWQRARNYGQRNVSELSIQRYKKILGNKLHAREMSRQKTEAMIGCGVLNKMTSLGMPQSYRAA